MDLKKVEKLVQLLKKHDLFEIEVENEGQRVRVQAGPQAPIGTAVMPTAPIPQPFAAASATPIANEGQTSAVGPAIKSPFVGTFYEATSPGAEAFVKPGQKVKKGEVLCIIEAMKIMNEIEAEQDCTIKEVLVQNGQPVEFDQPLFATE